MSSTNRGRQRNFVDNYPTPSWCVRRFTEAAFLPGGRWLEPASGDGAIVRAFKGRDDITWTTVDIRPECEAPARLLWTLHVTGDFLSLDPSPPTFITPFEVVISNPPFCVAMDMIEHAMLFAPYVVMLLRLNFLASGRRATFMQAHPPDVYVLPNRPSFSSNGRTDSPEYGWFVWPPTGPRTSGTLTVLKPTPKEERSLG